MNKKTKFAIVAWILIFLAFNLYFAFPLKDDFMVISEGDIYPMQMVQLVLSLMSFVFGEAGLIIALIAVLIKSTTSA